jgi:DDE domain
MTSDPCQRVCTATLLHHASALGLCVPICDLEGEVLESYVTTSRDKKAALRFMKKALKRHGSPSTITTDGLRSHKAAMTTLGNTEEQEVGAGPTTGWRTATCRSGDESGQCSGSDR